MDETRIQTPARPLRGIVLPRAGRHSVEAKRSLAFRNTVFRLGVIALMLVIFLAIRHLKGVVWPHGGHSAHNPFDQIVAWSALTWVLMVPWAMADVVGWMLYRRHTPVTEETRQKTATRRMRYPVVFRIVTRGDQPATVIATIWAVLEAMQARPAFRYRVEVVSDMPIDGLPDHGSVHAIVVPEEYETSNGATHKARALHYALSVSRIPDDAWILHLDEESHVTEGLIVGIREAVAEEERTGAHRIGQGLITYHRDLASNKLYSLADSIRVGDDIGRFHLQYRMHRILFGMHGSFLLVRSNIERQVGFDFPPEACTTEDTTWALRQMGAGNRFRWVDGTVIEQSPGTFRDFVRQRRRWFTGMWWAAKRTPVAARYRAPLMFAMSLWTIGWTGFAYSLLHVFSGVDVPHPIAVVGDAIFAVFVTNYLLGLWVSLSMREGRQTVRRLRYFVLQAVTIPIFTVLEGSAVVYSLLSPERRFHVVDKPTVDPQTVTASSRSALSVHP
jgi:egghead protein (zeste-white 4 protein)